MSCGVTGGEVKASNLLGSSYDYSKMRISASESDKLLDRKSSFGTLKLCLSSSGKTRPALANQLISRDGPIPSHLLLASPPNAIDDSSLQLSINRCASSKVAATGDII